MLASHASPRGRLARGFNSREPRSLLGQFGRFAAPVPVSLSAPPLPERFRFRFKFRPSESGQQVGVKTQDEPAASLKAPPSPPPSPLRLLWPPPLASERELKTGETRAAGGQAGAPRGALRAERCGNGHRELGDGGGGGHRGSAKRRRRPLSRPMSQLGRKPVAAGGQIWL